MLSRTHALSTLAALSCICGAAQAQSCAFFLGTPAGPFATTNRPSDAVVGDVTGNGIPDLVVIATGIAANAAINVLPGAPGGSFGAAITTTLPVVIGSEVNLVLADLNHDGVLDVVVPSPNESSIYVFRGIGNGQFHPPALFAVEGSPHRVAAGDVNGDGNIDIVASNLNGSSVSLLMGIGNGSFQNYVAVTTPLNGIYTMSLADLNNDGRLDLIVGAMSPGGIATMLGNGNGTFAPASVHTGMDIVRSLVVADATGDGRLDVVASTHNEYIALLRGLGNGQIQPRELIPIQGPLQLCMRVHVADLNQDGAPDILALGRESQSGVFTRLNVSLGQGGGAFGPVLNFGGSIPTGPHYALATIDANHDGLLDVIVGQIGDQGMLAFPNTGGGLVAINAHPQSVAASSGQSAQFTVAATGPNLQYQWMRNGLPLVEGSKFSGSATPTLTINSVGPMDQGLFTVRVANTCNSQTGAAFLYVVPDAACPADFNGDGQVDFFDYLDFVNAYSAGCD